MEELPLDDVVEGVNRELDLVKAKSGPHDGATGKRDQTSVRARFVVRQFAKSLDANIYSPTPGLEVTRVLLAMALSKDLTILFGDISVAFMNTPMPEGDLVYVEPPEGLYEHNDTVWCLKRALNGLRDASRLFHEYFVVVFAA